MNAESTQVRIYGLPIQLVHDQSLGPIAEMNEEFPFYGILYCGYKSDFAEVRQPSQRLWYFRKQDVVNSGQVDSFVSDGQAVRYYDLPLDARIFEKFYRELDLSLETASRPSVFAKQFAVSPVPPAGGYETIRNETPEAIEARVAAAIEEGVRFAPGAPGAGGAAGRPQPTLRTTYRETRYDPWSRGDNVGGDPDVQLAI